MRPPAGARRGAAAAGLLGLLACLLAAPAAPSGAAVTTRQAASGSPQAPADPEPGRSQPAASPEPTESPLTPVERAREAKGLEDAGLYRLAARQLEKLRRETGPDADLDLELALDLARAGAPDSARALLHGPTLSTALADSCPPARRRPYAWNRDETWMNGKFDGWRWYIARARAEVAARLGRWSEARLAARRAVEDRPLAGKEWLVLAVCSGHAGDLAAAEPEARMAAHLDPMLPEAHYLVGLIDWKQGRRREALERFAAALALDSLYEPAVRSRQRLRFFPGAAPDSLPAVFLTGERAAGLLTSPAGPKIESFQTVDRQPAILSRMMVPIPDSLEIELKPLRFVLPVLVDRSGRAVLNDLPWISPNDLPALFVSVLLESLPSWRFSSALRSGEPVPSWAAVSITTGQH
jgi:hypothetical protein